MDLTCPKCHGPMRTYERNGVHVDQCTDCRGIFLDRGELERLIDAENDWHDRPRGPQQPAAGHAPAGPQGAGLGAVVGEVLNQVRGGHSSSSHSSYGSGYGQPRRKKKESFLSDLFG
ncbi:TFIIB-type zinc ribbon-containing protein [Blastococcus sp. SYSU D00820]